MSVIKAITLCGERYGFNVSEAMLMLKGVGVGVGVGVGSVLKSDFALPYNGELNDNLCLGISRNGGVYSQCSKKRLSGKTYCGQCSKEASNNSHGLPNYGNIVDRQRAYLNKEEFKDPSGKSPIAYPKIMKKLKLSEEQVRSECEKMGVTLDPINLEEKTMKKSGRPKQIKPEKPAKEIKAKGRPKKSKKVLELAGEEEDLFASLVMSSLAPSRANSLNEAKAEIVLSEATVSVSEATVSEATVSEATVSVSEATVSVCETKAKKEKKSSSAKEEKALAKLKEKEEKALALSKEKEEKELAKLKEKEAKEEKAKEKEMKSLMLKLEKEKQKEELIEKKAALELEKAKAKELKEKKVSEKKVKKSKIDDDDVRPTPVFIDPPDEEADLVKKIMFEGKKYLKSKNTGVIYNMEQDVIGKWNEEKERIDFNEEEESEDEYDEDC
jgi:hypothetical protein